MILPIVSKFDVKFVYLFGSYAKGSATIFSDIDICIIANTENKREFLKNLYISANIDIMVDFILYSESEWKKNIDDEYSFANKILELGVLLYGG